MNSSDGRRKVQKELGHTKNPSGDSWDVLTSVRKKYPNIFVSEKEKEKMKIKEKNFDEFFKEMTTTQKE